MRNRAVFTALISVFLFGAVVAAQQWQELGPALLTNIEDNEGETSRVSVVMVSPTRADRYYIGGAMGGVWRSTNAGASWSPRTDRLPTLVIGALALDPSDDNILYAGTGEPNNYSDSLYGLGIYKSVNGGNTWRVLGGSTFSGRAISGLAVSSQDNNAVWAAVTPAGSRFRGTGPSTPVGDRRHPRRSGPVGIFRSGDGGETWAQVRNGLPNTPATDVLLDPRTNSRIYAAFGNIFGAPGNGVYRSTDGGTSFDRILAPEPSARLGRTDLAMAPSDPDRLYALISDNQGTISRTRGLFRSDNGGDSWIQLEPGEVHNTFGAVASALTVHPTDPNTLFVGSNALLRSQDGGATFTDIRIQTAGGRRAMHDLAIDAAGRLLVASDAGIFQSSDLGDSWTAINGGLRTGSFYVGLATHSSDPNLIIGGTRAGIGIRESDSLTWRRVVRASGAYSTIDPRDPGSIVIQVAGGRTVFRFVNGVGPRLSNTGITINERASLFAPMIRDPRDPDRLLFASFRVYESTDNGNSWQPISADLTGGPPAGVRAMVMAPSNPDTLYATTTDDRLLTSTDGGRTWQRRLTADVGGRQATRQIAVDPRDDSRAYVAISLFGGQSLLATTNRGATWTDIGQGLPDVPVNSVAVHRQGSARFILAGTDRGVWLSSNNGATWQEYGRLPNSPIQDLVVDTVHDRLLASTFGRGAWSTTLPTGGGGPGPTTCQEPLGSGRFCSACGPCAQGEGDCDNDGECQSGLSCAQNVGADFGFAPAVDVCVGDAPPPQSCPVGLGTGRFCSECGPCGAGQGDCDNDAECRSGLRCAQNVGTSFGFPAAVDVCVAGDPPACNVPLGNGRFCTECGPCDAGQGDCDSDAECRAGLTCAQNVGADFGFPAAVDVCVAGVP